VCKKNTGNLYWFGSKNALRPVREESYVLSCTKVLLVGVTSGRERGRGSQVSRCEWSACACDPFESLARSRRVACLCVVSCLCEGFTTCFSVFSRMVLACSFYSLKEVQGYKMWCVGDPCWGSSPRASGGLIRWRRGLYCRGMASVLLVLLLHGRACVPLLREWFLSFGIVAPRHTWSYSRRGVLVLVV
jgi:hypothetical protein